MLTKIAGNSVLSSTTLGTGVTSSSLTTVGTLTSGTWNATLITSQYGGTGFNNSAAAQYALPYYSATGVLGGTLAVGTTGQCLVGNTTAAPSWSSCTGLGTNYWQIANAGSITPYNTTVDLLLGGVSTSSATFHIYGSTLAGTSPVASISANTSYAGLVVSNSGKGDLFTASMSGATRFVIANDGSIIQNSNDTTGIAYTLNANSLTTGYGLDVSSTSTGLATNSALGYFSYNPGSATASTGDVLDLNVGANASGANGSLANIFNVMDNGSTDFSVSQTQVVSNLPVQFTAPGDTAIAYDLNFTNPISSFITSQAPLSLYAGELFNSSNLTLGTYNGGNVVIDSQALVANQAASISGQLVIGTSTAPANIGNFYLTNSSTFGKALAILNQTESADIFTASASGTTRFTIAQNGDITGTSLSLTQANENAFLGYQAGKNSPTGANNLFLGYNAGYNLNGASNNNVMIGPNAGPTSLGAVNSKLYISGSLTTTPLIGGDFANNLVGINTATPAATFDIRQLTTGSTTNGTLSIASISGKTSFAGLVVNNSGVGDLFTASSSGTTRFRMSNNGSVLFQGDTVSSIGSLGSAGGPTQTNDYATANAIGDEGSLVPNAGFESNLTVTKVSNTSDPNISDGWIAAATASASVVRIATDSAKGTSSLLVKLQASQSTAVYSTCMPLTLAVTGIYNLNFYAKASSLSPVVRGYLDQYTSRANCQSDTSRTVTTPGATTALTAATWVTLGTGASTFTTSTGNTSNWARVHIFIGCPATCAANTTVDLDGVRLIETSNAVGLDYAENYPADPNNTPSPGDVVSLNPNGTKNEVMPATTPMDNSVIGVVSTNPGMILDDGSMSDSKVPIALSGRVPVNVSTENGDINMGDYLTSSDIPGVAVKATSAGTVIGRAIESYSNSDPTQIGTINMYINVSYYGAGALTSSSTTLSATDEARLTNLENTTSQQGSEITSLSGQVNNLSDQENQLASQSAFLTSMLQSPLLSSLIASGSGTFADVGSLDMQDATVSGQLEVLGRTTLNDLGVTGTITAGVTTIDGLNGTIDTISQPLQLQSEGLANIELENNSVVIKTNGDITTQGVLTAHKVNIDESNKQSASVGQAMIPAGETTITVDTTAVTAKSHIFVTPRGSLAVPITVSSTLNGTSFTVSIGTAELQNIKFDWWIVN